MEDGKSFGDHLNCAPLASSLIAYATAGHANVKRLSDEFQVISPPTGLSQPSQTSFCYQQLLKSLWDEADIG